jgi:hypothetical protein
MLLCSCCLIEVTDTSDRAYPAVTVLNGDAVCVSHLSIAKALADKDVPKLTVPSAENLARFMHDTRVRMADALGVYSVANGYWSVADPGYRQLMVAVTREALRYLGLWVESGQAGDR